MNIQCAKDLRKQKNKREGFKRYLVYNSNFGIIIKIKVWKKERNLIDEKWN